MSSMFRSERMREALWCDGGLLEQVAQERTRQLAVYGEQHHPDGAQRDDVVSAELYRDLYEVAVAAGVVTWRNILLEEVYEATSEQDDKLRRDELLQVAAVALAWVEDIDGRA